METNFIYAFVLPVFDIFVAAYVMRNSQDARYVMVYQMALFTGIPLMFLATGYLLRFTSVKALYAAGMLLSSVALAVMISLPKLTITGIGVAGFMMGISFGLFWANRDYLVLSSTSDSNRNYYYGMETFFSTLCALVVPITVGWIIAGSEIYGWFGGVRNNAYYAITATIFLLSCASSFLILRGKFISPVETKFVYWRYSSLWYKVLGMAVFRGVGQGFMATAPAMLVIRLLDGKEEVLGTIQTVGGLVTAITFYVLGRIAKPKHRLLIVTVGVGVYFAGTITNALLFSGVGVVVFIACQLLGRPLIENAFFPIQMRVIDILSPIEGRSGYAYIFNHEFALFIGRLFGGVLFIVAATFVSEPFALRYVLVVIGALQIVTVFFCRSIVRDCHKLSPESDELMYSNAGEESSMGIGSTNSSAATRQQ